MTWRALFLRLLVSSTVVLVAAWSLSLFYATRLHLHGVELAVGHGSVEIRYQEFRDGSTSVTGPLGSRHGRFISQRRAEFPPPDLGLWNWRYGWNHSVMKIVARSSPTRSAHHPGPGAVVRPHAPFSAVGSLATFQHLRLRRLQADGTSVRRRKGEGAG